MWILVDNDMKEVPPRNTCEFVQGTGKIAYSTVLPQEWEAELSQKVPKIEAASDRPETFLIHFL